ncbi:TPA: hypothetical protein DEP34_00430 [Candidatus Uhrbacteria bacterium]|uniref:Negative regulator of genetic competence clpC/mecB n=2 Tax=Candidatus Uhriibacteriota TaxID=1752732 RepID=A0A0G1Q8B9_9BACT|nr:MAG: Negative regulator of genetic competence clpC/mecB [Candidatus Uhrbacteria bacterium GW2011_GWF2_46_218]KKU41234.1 MAG: Negative regulator of genetic competence clpC/mecB [Candidatus Uhrbacteria bacterium GW2011_GWE2_46_68]HBK34083.1 hypothetical protein [Candidatus Uhrbacteria bacterium]HCB18839.1 hypothetical protein [Candidatus Uhrbacteria bacterium]
MTPDIIDKFSTHLKNALSDVLQFVIETQQRKIEARHLLWALSAQKGSLASDMLQKANLPSDRLKTWIASPLARRASSAHKENHLLELSDDSKRAMEKAILLAHTFGHSYIGTEHLLSGLLQTEPKDVLTFFEKEQVNLTRLRRQLSMMMKSTSRFSKLAREIPQEIVEGETLLEEDSFDRDESQTPALDYFGRDLTEKAKQHQLDPVIGRGEEIERVMEILCRRTKNNPLLLGEAGVGKTAIVEGLANHIVQAKAPDTLLGKRVVTLDLAHVVAGTMYRGEFESRLKQIIEEAKVHPEVIVFIDEIHNLVGAGSASGSMDAASILKPALARGELRCIGATTPAEYKKSFESDHALERRFQIVRVEEPDLARTKAILKGIAPSYEEFHRITITQEAIETAATLSDRYFPHKHQPDKAIDLVDEASARAHLQTPSSPALRQRRQLEQKWQEAKKAKKQAVLEERYEDATMLKEEEDHLADLVSKLPLLSKERLGTISKEDIFRVVSRMTRIPLDDLLGSDTNARTLSARLGEIILGQSEAITTISGALQHAKMGLQDPRRPLASFLFLGPSGVGKTEMAKAIAHQYFQDPKAIVRFDMSEYAEGFTVSKLMGSPAGYVGYRESAALTDRIKQRPHTVLLFDEIEKAHRDVQNILLQILEEGELMDATGRSVSFRHALVILTSNIGLERFEQGSMGFQSDARGAETKLAEDLQQELKDRLRPELLNRLDHVCIFRPLTPDTLKHITNQQLNALTKRLADQNIVFTWDKGIVDIVIKTCDPGSGARAIRQAIQTKVEYPIAEMALQSPRPLYLKAKVARGSIVLTKSS